MPKKNEIEAENKKLKEELETLKLAVVEIRSQVKTPSVADAIPTPKIAAKEWTEPTSEPVPADYVKVVEAMLNSEFRVRVNSDSHIPGFWFTVVVPKKYSLASEEYLKVYHEDIRPTLIQYSDGIDGVKLWIEKVWNTFNPDYKAMIVSERFKQNVS